MTPKDIFDTMEYGTAPESASEALAWLVDQGSSFGHFINGAWTEPTADFTSRNPANGNTLALTTRQRLWQTVQVVGQLEFCGSVLDSGIDFRLRFLGEL